MLKDLNYCLTSVFWYVKCSKAFSMTAWFIQVEIMKATPKKSWQCQLQMRAQKQSTVACASHHQSDFFFKLSQWNLDTKSTPSSRILFYSETNCVSSVCVLCVCICTQINLSVWAFMPFPLNSGIHHKVLQYTSFKAELQPYFEFNSSF